jgi:hypothetical protein
MLLKAKLNVVVVQYVAASASSANSAQKYFLQYRTGDCSMVKTHPDGSGTAGQSNF